jgi:hypothetical protein
MNGGRGTRARIFTTLRAVQRLDQPVDVAPGSSRPSVASVRWRGWPDSLRNDSTNCA